VNDYEKEIAVEMTKAKPGAPAQNPAQLNPAPRSKEVAPEPKKAE
jgi:hypothetical protein